MTQYLSYYMVEQLAEYGYERDHWELVLGAINAELRRGPWVSKAGRKPYMAIPQ